MAANAIPREKLMVARKAAHLAKNEGLLRFEVALDKSGDPQRAIRQAGLDRSA
jgi:hypothetical protein